jgi:hypothetical protein
MVNRSGAVTWTDSTVRGRRRVLSVSVVVYPYPPGPLCPHAEKGGASAHTPVKSLSVYGFEGGQVDWKH